MADNKSVNIGDYLVSKDGKTKYIKLQCSPKADAKTKKMIEDLKKLLGSDVLYVNLFTPEFKDKFKIPDFAKGRISIPEGGSSLADTDKDGVDF